ncbi:hypothetical protein [Desulfomarina sp.]
MKNKENLTEKLQAIIEMGNKVLATETQGFQKQTFVDEQKFHDFRIAGLSLLSRIFGDTSQHYTCFKSEVTIPGSSRTKRGIGILTSATRELQGNWLETTRGNITLEILEEFMDMARGYIEMNTPAAAIILMNAVLEKHLRNLCQANGIDIINRRQSTPAPKRSLQLASEGYKKKLFDRGQNKKLLSWLELCGRINQDPTLTVSTEQADKMYRGLRRFLTATPY